MDREHESSASAIVPAVAVGSLAAWIAVVNPPLGIVAAAAAPMAVDRFQALIERVWRREDSRNERLLVAAARVAGVDIDGLLRRCEERPDLEELLVKCLRAVGDTSLRGKVHTLAVTLA